MPDGVNAKDKELKLRKKLANIEVKKQKKLISEVKDMKENKGLSVTKIARVTGKCRSTIYKILKTELGYVSNRLVKQESKNESK